MLRSSPLLALLVAATAASAQEEGWTIYSTDPAACYVMAAPVSSVNTRDGAEVEVSRGTTRLVVSWQREVGMAAQVSFTGGYPFDPATTVTAEAGGQEVPFTVDGEWSYAASPEADAALIAVLRQGGETTLSGISSRGTATRDTFSLEGFGAAIDTAMARCAG